MTTELPPLPEPYYGPDTHVDEEGEGAFTAAQMHAYAHEHASAKCDEFASAARRYRWLRDNKAGRNPESVQADGSAYWIFYSSPLIKGRTLNEAIDAAIEQSPRERA